ncbi:MAG: DUF616 domain-containing protein [Bacteroides sp.]|nr:DUF616 domain-containing protein [Bacteroides sp.]
MRLNCERINIINTNPYLAGVNALSQNKSSKLKRLWRSKNILHHIKQKIKHEYYKRNSSQIIDFTVPFKPRQVEDFLVDNYHHVGKGVVYTAVFGGYDTIEEPMIVNPNLDYFAFTDSDLPKDSVWKKFDLSKYKHLKDLDSYHLAKYIKMFPYEFFPNHDFSIWIDGNVQLIADTYPLAIMSHGSPMATYSNPIHDCIYTEAKYMVFQGRLPKFESDIQLNEYKQAGFPKHFGMREFSIIYRDHSSQECYDMMKQWWEQVNSHTMRDQLSLPFILWKNGKSIDYIRCLGENWRWNPRFKQKEHHYQIMYNQKH